MVVPIGGEPTPRYQRAMEAIGKAIGTAIVVSLLLGVTAVGVVIGAFIVLILRSLAG